MKKHILLIIVLIASKSQGQFRVFENYYFDCLESSYQMNYGITLSSIEGNYEKANTFLNSDFLKNNPEKQILIKALLCYNTLGKKRAYELIDTNLTSEEKKESAKLWLSFYSKNNEEFNQNYTVFRKKHPDNYEPLKLKFRGHIDYRDKNFWNDIYNEKQNSLRSIDSLLALNSVKNEDRIYFSLIKLEFLKKEETDRKEDKVDIVYPQERLISELLSLWKANKTLFNTSNLSRLIDDCTTDDCKEAIAYLAEEARKTDTSSSTQKTVALLVRQNNGDDVKPSVAELEKSIMLIKSTEKSQKEIARINALITVFSLEKEPELGFFFRGMLKPIAFSTAFKQKSTGTQDKASLLADIESVMNEAAKENGNSGFVENFKNESETLKNLSVDDLKALYGLAVFSQEYAKLLKSAFQTSFLNYSESPSFEEISDIRKYVAFLEKNPLYYDKSAHSFNYPDLKSEKDVWYLIEETKRLKEKFPGSMALLNNCILTLSYNHEAVSDAQKQNFYLIYIKFLCDLFPLMPEKSISDTSEGCDYFPTLNTRNLFSKSNCFEDFYKLLSKESQKELENYISQKLIENPGDKKLISLTNMISKAKN